MLMMHLTILDIIYVKIKVSGCVCLLYVLRRKSSKFNPNTLYEENMYIQENEWKQMWTQTGTSAVKCRTLFDIGDKV